MSIESLIREKYASQVEAARVAGMGAAQVNQPAHMLGAQASMVNANANMGELPIRRMGAEADLMRSRAMRDRVPAQNEQDQAMSQYYGGKARWETPSTDALDKLRRPSDTSMSEPFGGYSGMFSPTERGYKRGTARVPGKGSGKVDTVNAKLAPGEAVLNKAGAEMAGRDNIAALNAAGAQKMGLGMRGRDERHYASGVESVPADWRIGPMDGSSGRGAGQGYPATMSRGGPPVPMMATPAVDIPPKHWGITDPGEGGSTGPGGGYFGLFPIQRGRTNYTNPYNSGTPHYAAGTAYVGRGMLGAERARGGPGAFEGAFSTNRPAAKMR